MTIPFRFSDHLPVEPENEDKPVFVRAHRRRLPNRRAPVPALPQAPVQVQASDLFISIAALTQDHPQHALLADLGDGTFIVRTHPGAELMFGFA